MANLGHVGEKFSGDVEGCTKSVYHLRWKYYILKSTLEGRDLGNHRYFYIFLLMLTFLNA